MTARMCFATGKFEDEPCAKCADLDARLARTRKDPRVIEATAATDTAWNEMQNNRAIPLKEWLKLECAWRKASDDARAVFSHVFQEVTSNPSPPQQPATPA